LEREELGELGQECGGVNARCERLEQVARDLAGGGHEGSTDGDELEVELEEGVSIESTLLAEGSLDADAGVVVFALAEEVGDVSAVLPQGHLALVAEELETS
jgi:hypothetical protein